MNKFFVTFACVALMASTATPTFAASGSVHITNSMLKNGIFTNTENVGGGVWNYGTHIDGLLLDQKTVWSNYQHKTNYHSASCKIGNRTPNSSDKTAPGTEAKSSQTGAKNEETHAWWNNEA